MFATRRGFLGLLSLMPFANRSAKATTPVHRTVEFDRFHVAGFRFHDGPKMLGDMKVGDSLTLRRNADNPHDSKAVELLFRDRRIGYVPRKRNRILARMLDQGASMTAAIHALDPQADPWEQVQVNVEISCAAAAS